MREAVGRGDFTLQRGDDAGRQRALEVERVADRVGRVADLDGARVAEHQRVQREAVGGDAQHGEVVGGILAEHLRFDGLAFFEADVDLDRVLDHVVVGEDRAVAVDHDAGAGGLALTLGFAEQERRFGFLHDGGGDEGHAGRVALVDFVGREGVGHLCGVLGFRRRRGGGDGGDGGVARAESAEGGDDPGYEGAPDQGADERN